MSEFVIPFNKAPLFRNEFISAIDAASKTRSFSGDGLNSKRCCEYLQNKYGFERTLLTPSCTAALEMAALLLDLGPGDEVIVPSYTFVTSASAFALRGAKIIFADSEVKSPIVSVSDIVRKITTKTKAIVVVHYAGIAVDVGRILRETNGIPVVEDCAQAIDSIDSKNDNDYIGKLGCLSTFSFHETKNVGIGEGGLLVVNDEKMWLKAQIIREKGTNRVEFKKGNVSFYSWVSLGSSFLMSDIDAAMLWSTLQHVDEIQKRRKDIWDAYDKNIYLNSVFDVPHWTFKANAHMYYLRFHDPAMVDVFCNAMKKSNIIVAKHYVPLHLSSFAKSTYGQQSSCPQSELWGKTLVRIPLFYDLDDDSVNKIVTMINNFSKNYGYLFKPADETYWEDIRFIRNNNGEFFANSGHVEKDEHWNFMRKHHKNYFVATENEKCIGFVGHVKRDYRLGTCRKGEGVAMFMTKCFMHKFGHLEFSTVILRKNMRVLGFARKAGYFPEKKSWESGEDPLKLILLGRGEVVDIWPQIKAKL